MDIINFIDFVIDITNDIYDDVFFSAKHYYLNGGCYYFALIIKKYYDCDILISKDNNHCAILYKNNIYDASGKIIGDFKLADEDDIIYMEERFNKLYKYKEIVKEIDKSNIF